MFCPNCGTELEDGSEFCQNCGTSLIPTISPQKKKINYDAWTMVATVFSVISFLFGFIIITTNLATGRTFFLIEFIAIIPAFVGLGASVYKLFNKPEEQLMKKLTVLNLLLTGFTILYAFVYIMVIVA